MADWITAVDDLRNRLYDTNTSRIRWQKKVFGDQNGTNKRFKTFEDRRITNFTSPTAPAGVFVNGVSVTVSTDYPDIGEFVLSAAPAATDSLTATYYNRLFLDDELISYLSDATDWLGYGPNYLILMSGLRPSALCYAAADAYQNLAIRYAEMPSETYRLEDSPDDKAEAPLTKYFQMSDAFRKQAKNLRDAFYTRQGQSLQPLFGTVVGVVPNIP